MLLEVEQAHRGDVVPKVRDGLEAAQAWLQDVWEGFREAGRPDLASRTWSLIRDLERLGGDARG